MVKVDFTTAAPYFYNGTDQSGTVAATFTDVNGQPVDLSINWHGKAFVEVGYYTISAEFIVTDFNYQLTGNTLTLQIYADQNVHVDYTPGTDPDYSSVIPSMWGEIWSKPEPPVGIDTMTWGELISETMLDYRASFNGSRDYPGMNYTTGSQTETITVDSLKFRPMEIDSITGEFSGSLNPGRTLSKPQGLYLGKELFIDANHPESDQASVFEMRYEAASPEHEPVRIEQDYSAEENTDMTVSLVSSFKTAAPGNQNLFYDLPVQDAGLTGKAENMKSDLEKLIDDLIKVS